MSSEQTIREMAGLIGRDGSGPIYLQIAQQVKSRIEQGELLPGQCLPTQQRLARLLGVGEVTVRRALAELGRQGLVRSRRGSGTLVADRQGGRRAAPSGAWPIHIVFADAGDGYPFLHPLVESLRRSLSESGGGGWGEALPRLVHLEVGEHNPAAIRERVMLHQTRGLILNSPVNLTLVSQCVRLGVPYVMLFNDLADGCSPCVGIDYGPGLAGAMEHLLSRGRRRMVLMTPENDRFSAARLAEVFQVLSRAYGLTGGPESIVAAGYHQLHGYTATMRLLGGADRPEAIIYSSDYQALGGLRAAADLGLRVPEDLGVVGAGPLLRASDWPGRISTIDLHLEQLARLAVEMLLRASGGENGSAGALRRTIAGTFVAGETT